MPLMSPVCILSFESNQQRQQKFGAFWACEHDLLSQMIPHTKEQVPYLQSVLIT